MNATSNLATKPQTGTSPLGAIRGCNSSSASSAWHASRTCSTAGRCSSIPSMPNTIGGAPPSKWRSPSSFSSRPGWFRSKAIWSTASVRAGWCSAAASWSAIAWIDQFMREFASGPVLSPPPSAASAPDRVYGTCVGNALKWFPGRRGIAAGLTASGFGAGAALTIVPISHMINSAGYEQAFLVFGLLPGRYRVRDVMAAAGAARATIDRGGEAQPNVARLHAR